MLHVGVSDWSAWDIAQANTLAELRDWSPFVGVQPRYNLLARSVESELTPMARAHDLAIVAWGPLLGATSEEQPTTNLGALDSTLDDDVLRRLDEISAPELGFPHDVMAGEDMIGLTNGDQWRQVTDRRRASRRPVNDNDRPA